MKFEESKVINGLHKEDVKFGTTGFFSDDICVLKDAVENVKEDYFSKLTELDESNKKYIKSKDKRPFYSAKKEGSFLFYPATSEEAFGGNYIDFEKEYTNISNLKLDYKEFVNIYNSQFESIDEWKQYLFSASLLSSYKPVTVLISAPNLKAAVLMIRLYAKSTYYWEKEDNNDDCCHIRYFGEFDKGVSYPKIKNSLKLFETEEYYNLKNTPTRISFDKISKLKNGWCKDRFISLVQTIVTGNIYCEEELKYILENNKVLPTETIKDKVDEAFKKNGISTDRKIYDDELILLSKDFSYIKDIIKIIKDFDKEDFKELEAFTNNLKTRQNLTFILERPSFFIEEYHYVGGRSVYYKEISKSVAYIMLKGNCVSRLNDFRSFYVFKKDIKSKDLERFIEGKFFTSGITALEISNELFCISNDFDILSSDSITSNLTSWHQFVQKEYTVKNMTKYDIEEIKSFGEYGFFVKDFKQSKIKNHNCIVLNTGSLISSSRYSKYNDFSKYTGIINKMYGFKYHLVKVDNLSDNHDILGDKYENKNLYFAINKDGKDYSKFCSEYYWKELVEEDRW